MKTALLPVSMLLSVAACGGGETVTPDAMGQPLPDVVSVTCPAAPDAEVGTANFAFTPSSTTISVGEVVRFTMEGIHNVSSTGGDFSVGFGAVGCFRFDSAGSFPYRCTAHGQMTGTITVQ